MTEGINKPSLALAPFSRFHLGASWKPTRENDTRCAALTGGTPHQVAWTTLSEAWA